MSNRVGSVVKRESFLPGDLLCGAYDHNGRGSEDLIVIVARLAGERFFALVDGDFKEFKIEPYDWFEVLGDGQRQTRS